MNRVVAHLNTSMAMPQGFCATIDNSDYAALNVSTERLRPCGIRFNRSRISSRQGSAIIFYGWFGISLQVSESAKVELQVLSSSKSRQTLQRGFSMSTEPLWREGWMMIWRRSLDRCLGGTENGRRTRNIKLLRLRELRTAPGNSMVLSNGIFGACARRRSAHSESSGHSVDSGQEDATKGWRIRCRKKSLVEGKSQSRKNL